MFFLTTSWMIHLLDIERSVQLVTIMMTLFVCVCLIIIQISTLCEQFRADNAWVRVRYTYWTLKCREESPLSKWTRCLQGILYFTDWLMNRYRNLCLNDWTVSNSMPSPHPHGCWHPDRSCPLGYWWWCPHYCSWLKWSSHFRKTFHMVS